MRYDAELYKLQHALYKISTERIEITMKGILKICNRLEYIEKDRQPLTDDGRVPFPPRGIRPRSTLTETIKL